jgi:hypothetical protein
LLNIALQLDGPFNCGELVLDFDVLVMHYCTVRDDISYTVRLLEGEVELHLPGITESAMLAMQGVGKELFRVV